MISIATVPSTYPKTVGVEEVTISWYGEVGVSPTSPTPLPRNISINEVSVVVVCRLATPIRRNPKKSTGRKRSAAPTSKGELGGGQKPRQNIEKAKNTPKTV